MAQSLSKELTVFPQESGENTAFRFSESNVCTGDDNCNRQLLGHILDSMKKARKIDISVSFIMESGVRIILDELKSAVKRGAGIRILTGTYLDITQPSALYLLKNHLGDGIELRMYAEKNRSFHPKAYIFHYDRDFHEIFIGSSNISGSALTSGIEWNYRFNSVTDKSGCRKFQQTFDDLWLNRSITVDDAFLKEYSRYWHHPPVLKYEEEKVTSVFQPRGSQIEALYALEHTRSEGADKGLVIAATGVGKTALAAFDSLKFKRILFVAHRDEIIKKAGLTFASIRKTDDIGFFNASEKCTDRSVIMASVATLGNDRYLSERYFRPDFFDYIIIDETHHGVASQYRRIINYFKPKFMLGLTATPERMDKKDIFELFDYNVPYEISLGEAINKGYLVPFRYYGIYDDTDYSGLHPVNGRYDNKELNETYIGNVRRHELIYRNYLKYRSKKALAFCCSREHAEEMAREFNRRGIRAAAVYSNAEGAFSEKRHTAVEKLLKGEISVIFSVDMFNEGVDIVSLDMVMFLRPTESPVIFLQQLGRGLRTGEDKKYLTVLDFIGNYVKAGKIIKYLTEGKSDSRTNPYGHSNLPDGCQVDFDLKLIDLFATLNQRQMKLKDIIRQEYLRVKAELGKKPDRIALFNGMDNDVYRLAVKHAKENPFNDYSSFLREINELTPAEEEIYSGFAGDFLKMLETTVMTKVYKMPVLSSFLNGSCLKPMVTEEDLLESWLAFFSKNSNWLDLDKDTTYEKFLSIDRKWHTEKIFKMPVKFLLQTENLFFRQDKPKTLSLNPQLAGILSRPDFVAEFRDIINYRTVEYYRRRYEGKNSR